MTKPSLHIAVAVIRDPDGNILISQRREGTPGAGLWEFPGGKREAGETIPEALRRELQEELGMTVTTARPLIRIRHAYTDRQVLLDTWLVTEWAGEPYGRERQLLEWVTQSQLVAKDLLPANGPITAAARLPAHYLITPDADSATLLTGLRQSLAAGRRLIRLRAATLSDSDYAALASEALRLCKQAGAALLLDREASMAEGLGAHGLHLTAARLMSFTERPNVKGWLAASCHNVSELKQAEALGCDFAVLGPVAATASHPGMPGLGWAQAAELIDSVNLPVYCIGGMQEKDCVAAHDAGAQGIAAIRGLWL